MTIKKGADYAIVYCGITLRREEESRIERYLKDREKLLAVFFRRSFEKICAEGKL